VRSRGPLCTMKNSQNYNVIKSKLILLLMVTLKCFFGLSQNAPEKMKLKQSFIDSIHAQTREHIIIDTLSNYYNQFEQTSLNQPQKDLVFILNFQDSLYSYDFMDFVLNHSEIILVDAYEVFQRVKCRTTQERIENYRNIYNQYSSYFEKGLVPDILNGKSHHFDAEEEERLYQALYSLEEWITMLPREKVLSVYQYIVDNKAFLYY